MKKTSVILCQGCGERLVKGLVKVGERVDKMVSCLGPPFKRVSTVAENSPPPPQFSSAIVGCGEGGSWRLTLCECSTCDQTKGTGPDLDPLQKVICWKRAKSLGNSLTMGKGALGRLGFTCAAGIIEFGTLLRTSFPFCVLR